MFKRPSPPRLTGAGEENHDRAALPSLECGGFQVISAVCGAESGPTVHHRKLFRIVHKCIQNQALKGDQISHLRHYR